MRRLSDVILQLLVSIDQFAQVAIVGLAYISKLDEQGRRIAVLEEQAKQQQEIDKRTTRIEAKLDVLVPQQDREARR